AAMGAGSAVAVLGLGLDLTMLAESTPAVRSSVLVASGLLAVIVAQLMTLRHVRKQNQRSRELAAQFDSLLLAAGDAVHITGRKTRITLINRKAENMFGYQTAELKGRLLETLFTKASLVSANGSPFDPYGSTATTVLHSPNGMRGRCRDGRLL